MSVQPSETESTEDFRDSNLVLGLAVATVMAFAWWGLMDRLQISYSGREQDASVSQQLVTLLRNTFPNGFWMGTLLLQKRIRMPLRSRIVLAIKGAFAGGLLYLGIGVLRILLESALGEAYGSLVYFGLSSGSLAFVFASAWVIACENQSQSFSFRRYLSALPRLSRAGMMAIAVWTLDGVSLGLALTLALRQVDNGWLFTLIPWGLTVWGLWLSKPAVIFDPVRRRNAIRAVISVVAVVGPLLLMALNVQLGLMVVVSVILLYAVITLRK
jgi:hypothetical protein